MQESVEVRSGTPIHLPMMVAAEEARDRCLAASAGGRDVLTDAMVAILLAAVALETGIYWVADQIGPSLLEQAQEKTKGIARKWVLVLEARTKTTAPTLGSGLGQALVNLERDRGWIAHYPGRWRTTRAVPLMKDGRQTATRAHFTPDLATSSVVTAAEALRCIGVSWAHAGSASGTGLAHGATVQTRENV